MIQVYKTYVQPVIQNIVLFFGSKNITRIKYLDQTFKRLHRIVFHRQKFATLKRLIDYHHLCSATDLHLSELFKTLNKIVRIVEILVFCQDCSNIKQHNFV